MPIAQLELERAAGDNSEILVVRLNGKLGLETVHDFIATMRPEPAAVLILDMSRVLVSGFGRSGRTSVALCEPPQSWEEVDAVGANVARAAR